MKAKNKDFSGAASEQLRFCKVCHCELPSKHRGKKCDACNRESAKRWRELGTAALGTLGLAALAVVPKITKKK